MSHPLITESTYNAPVDIVWQAITDREQMKQWYFDIESFKPEVGFEFTFKGENEGRVYIHLCKITEVIPGRKLKHSWRYQDYEGISYVTFELFPEEDKTRIKLTHEGLESFPALPDFARNNFKEGWTMIIGTLLKDFVEK
ncbi:MAG TPA: SRPBCC domain-containing protein [Saprospiraceae bacterium]|nr:SRPBCC domain-containing protein [Saprospiraceae bacterium]